MKEAFQHMMEILAKLEEKNIYYKLDMVSTKHDRILIEICNSRRTMGNRN